jgi:diaminopimelate decarboxylase
MTGSYPPEAWGLAVESSGALALGGLRLTGLARTFGTPLHVVSASHLRRSARDFLASARAAYPGEVAVHYALKCNGVPGVVEQVRAAGLGAEVCTGQELHLARRLGFAPTDIVVNGPGKTDAFLAACIDGGVKLIVVDSLDELAQLDRLARGRAAPVTILVRVNPGYVPEGVNKGTATASRHGSAFGLDLKGGEVHRALHQLQGCPGLHLRGVHMHIGTGIRSPRAWRGALQCLPGLRRLFREAGRTIEVVDLGGGIASRTTREMGTMEMALYGMFGRLPTFRPSREMPTLDRFLAELAEGVIQAFEGAPLPELIFEPGRRIASASQCLLVTVLGVKRRHRVGTWVTTDGGLSTATMPTYYECHEVLLCDDARRPAAERVTLNGPACFAGDIIYRNIAMPELRPGEVLAIMDSGAYFTALESSFGFERPAVALVDGRNARIIRTRETYEGMLDRDSFGSPPPRPRAAPPWHALATQRRSP